MAITVTRLTSRRAYSVTDAAMLTLVAMAIALLASMAITTVASLFIEGVLPADLLSMTFDGFLQYAAGYGILAWLFIMAFDLITDVKFARDYDVGEVTFGAILGPVVSIALVKLGVIEAAVLVGNLWLWPALALVYFLMKVTIGR